MCRRACHCSHARGFQEETMIVEAKKIVEEEPVEKTIAEADLPKGSWAKCS